MMSRISALSLAVGAIDQLRQKSSMLAKGGVVQDRGVRRRGPQRVHDSERLPVSATRREREVSVRQRDRSAFIQSQKSHPDPVDRTAKGRRALCLSVGRIGTFFQSPFSPIHFSRSRGAEPLESRFQSSENARCKGYTAQSL